MRVPSLQSLRYLVSLYDEQSFSRAAKACSVSQSTLSAAILKLEERFDAVLVERTNKTLQFTSLGHELVERARPILLAVKELAEVGSHKGRSLAGRLGLGIIPTIAPFLLPRFLADLRRELPELDLAIREDLTHRLLDELHAGKLDLVLLALPYAAPNIATVSIGRDPFRFVCHADSPLAAAPQVAYADIPDGAILLLEEGHCLREHAIEACRIREQDKISLYAFASLHTLVQMVNLNLGVTFLPQIAIDAGILTGTSVVVHGSPALEAHRELGLAWRKSSVRTADFLALAARLRALVAREPAPAFR